MTVHTFEVAKGNGECVRLDGYKGKVLLIVNTATKCGFTPQLEGLQRIYETYREEGLEILGFPCNQFGGQEPHTNEEIPSVCKINYGVTFPMFAKVDVKGKEAHPLFQYLIKESPGFLTEGIKWNFTKFLIDREGIVVKRYAPNTKPEKMVGDIDEVLNKPISTDE